MGNIRNRLRSLSVAGAVWLALCCGAMAQTEPVAVSTSTTDKVSEVKAAKTQKAAPDYSGKDGRVITDRSPLINALIKDDAEAVRKAIAAGAKVNDPTTDASYPIIVATQKASVEVMKILTAHGADVTVADRFGRTGMHYAAMKGDTQKLTMLAALKANVNALDGRDISPLYYAYLNKQIEAAKLMNVTLGADVNQPDRKGEMLAFRVIRYKDRPEVVREMIDAGLNLFKRNGKERNLIQEARHQKFTESEQLLKTAYEQQIREYIEKQKALEEQKKKADE